MEVKPVESKDKEQRLLGYEGANPTVMEIPVSFQVLFINFVVKLWKYRNISFGMVLFLYYFMLLKHLLQESSLLSRLASRARRLSVLSQWLVCAALFLCFVSMLSISMAILKQIKSQKYLNLRVKILTVIL